MSKAILAGIAGGIIGTITTAVGIIWIFITYTFFKEILTYASNLSLYLTYEYYYGYALYPYISVPFLITYYPSASLLGLLSFLMSILLVVTCILVGIGFYGVYKIGGGAMGEVSLLFSIVGSTLGAFLIVMGNLTNDYIYSGIMGGFPGIAPISISTPNFSVIGMGFVGLGFTFILLGIASIAVHETTEKPDTSYAAGILSIIGAVVFIFGGLGFIITNFSIGAIITDFSISGIIANFIIIAIGGFGLIFIAFILWAIVFYSSREI